VGRKVIFSGGGRNQKQRGGQIRVEAIAKKVTDMLHQRGEKSREGGSVSRDWWGERKSSRRNMNWGTLTRGLNRKWEEVQESVN